MAKERMTLYEALSRKAVLEKKISGRKYRLVDTVKKNLVDSKDDLIAELDKNIYAGFQQMVANHANLVALKSAINEANAITKITVAGKEYSIANAIVRHRELDTEERIYTSMLDNFTQCRDVVNRTNESTLSSDAIAKYIATVIGDAKRDEAFIESLKESYIRDNEVVLYDPLNTEKIATEKLDEIRLFREQIHFALTEINIKTTIEVDFVD